VTDFDQITHDTTAQQALRDAYNSVDAIDLWLGGISEDHIPLGNVGPLIGIALLDQFIRLRDGDRFFYSRDPDLKQPLVHTIIDLNSVTLGKIIRWNTNANVPNHVFHVHE
jgi:peroxidase